MREYSTSTVHTFSKVSGSFGAKIYDNVLEDVLAAPLAPRHPNTFENVYHSIIVRDEP